MWRISCPNLYLYVLLFEMVLFMFLGHYSHFHFVAVKIPDPSCLCTPQYFPSSYDSLL